jgi:hypothetical protein
LFGEDLGLLGPDLLPLLDYLVGEVSLVVRHQFDQSYIVRVCVLVVRELGKQRLEFELMGGGRCGRYRKIW